MAEISVEAIPDPTATPEQQAVSRMYGQLFAAAARDPAFSDSIEEASLQLSHHLVQDVPPAMMQLLKRNPDQVSQQLLNEFYVCVMARASAAVLAMAISRTRGLSTADTKSKRLGAFTRNMTNGLDDMLESRVGG